MACVYILLYRLIAGCLHYALPLYLQYRARRGKEDIARLPERFGVPSVARPEGTLFWLHGASVGETMMTLPLIDYWSKKDPSLKFLVTSGTRTAAQIVAPRLPQNAVHQYVPLDTPQAMRAFMVYWRPKAIILLESEIWPHLIQEASKRHISLFLLNARMSVESYQRWRYGRQFIRYILGKVSAVGAQSPADAERLISLGARVVTAQPSLKFLNGALPCDNKLLKTFQAALKGRTSWLAASTHPGEEEVILDAHHQLLKHYPDLLLVLVPRHMARVPAIRAMIKSYPLHVTLRSESDTVPTTGVWLVDTMGEMGLFYRLFPIAFVGASLVPGIGGHNIIESVQLGGEPIHGPYMDNAKPATDLLDTAGVAHVVPDAAAIVAHISARLSTSSPSTGTRAKKIIQTQTNQILPFLDQIYDKACPEGARPEGVGPEAAE